MSEHKNNFFSDVYEVVKLIPKGRATSYGGIAQYLGSKGSARMVGWALNSIAGDLNMPAHRVLNRNGRLTGKRYFGNPNKMQELLESEGVKIKGDQVLQWEKIYWDPSIELVI